MININHVSNMPLKGSDKKKERKIRKILEQAGREGIWIRELARQAKVPYSTVRHYLNNFMKDEVVIEDMSFGGSRVKKFKIVKFKGV